MRGLLAMLLASVPSVALAGATNVTSGTSYATIGDAVTLSSPGDEILVDPGVHAEQIVIPHALTIRGAGVGATTIEGVGSWYVVDFGGYGVSLTLEDLTVSSATPLQQLITTDLNGSLTLRRVDLIGGDAYEYGGAIYGWLSAIVLEDVFITGSHAALGGAAIYNAGLTIDATNLVVQDTTGVAAIMADASDLNCTSCTFQNTVSAYDGGAIWASGAAIVLDHVDILGAVAERGAVIHMQNASDALFRDVYIDGPETLDVAGGACTSLAGTSLSFEHSVICAPADGASIVAAGSLQLDNTAVIDDFEGWVIIEPGGDVNVRNSAFSGAKLYVEAGSYDVENTVFFNDAEFRSVVGASGNAQYNLFRWSYLAAGGVSTANSLVDVDPMWVDFTDDGDCTNDLLGPQRGSPLIDAGNPAILDPDGSRSDIGPHGGPAADLDPWFLDSDGDTFIDMLDCDPLDPAVNPDAIEVCDGIDNNCDGVADEDDAVDAIDWYRDSDGDGAGRDQFIAHSCVAPPNTADNTLDCDDTDPLVQQLEWREDLDGDGASGDGILQLDCVAPGPTWVQGPATDCDDADATVFPGAVETCDPADQDCDGDPYLYAIDPLVWSADVDGDGHGSETGWVFACVAPGPDWLQGYGQDCDDSDAAVNHDAVEVCDGIDNNCFLGEQDAADWGVWIADFDQDGHGVEVTQCGAPAYTAPVADDCDDTNDQVHPGFPEVCDGLDNNCDDVVDNHTVFNTWYRDEDGDGFHGQLRSADACWVPEPGWTDYSAGFDCDDANADRAPTLDEVCDGIDNDCDELVDVEDADLVDGMIVWSDVDGDGFGSGQAEPICGEPTGNQVQVDGDCDSDDPEVNPGATEIPGNDVDEDCDGVAEPAPEVPDDRKKDRGEPEASGCGCDASTGPLGAVGWLALLPLIGLRRR